ncbi:MAG: amino acid adenylation domain-containing protein [Undibacterium umbellatum]|uniref:amino acid adenylation domain-containing protein n=1 Tax=Undibacterium umbellatum TaxID=2762300 RepID=UPI003BB5081D
MKKTANLLISGFLNAARNYPNSNALWVDEQVYTYAELLLRVARISRTLDREIKHAHQQRCAVLVDRSITAYASVLGSLLAGMSYVPLNAKFPAQRNLRMLELSSSTSIVVDERSLDAAKEILQAYPDPLMVLMPETDSLPTWAASASQHTYILKRQMAEADTANLALPQKVNPVAYVLFTSGSTGLPKGVAVTNDNASTYVANIIERYQPGPGDRFTQFFDFTFDLSVHDIFVSLSSGACLYSVPGRVMMMPLKFVQQHELTHWFSVPSLAACLKRYNALRPDILPSLKYSLFCGEALPTSLAQDWQPAAPNSIIENLYGPTEATIAFTVYPYQADDQRIAALPVVPIGMPLPGQEVVILDEHFLPVADGEIGELYLGGSQLAQGYWENTELTRQRFLSMHFEGKQASRWYRTGDLASFDAQAGLLYGGRIDNQVKIRGYRVEVQEVEAVIRRLGGSDLVAVVPWPLAADGSVQGLLAYGCGFTVSSMDILKACTLQLPAYMVPQDLIELRKMPFNSNGKIDYPALQKMAGDGDKLKREAVVQGP